jgi:hypothetical protein
MGMTSMRVSMKVIPMDPVIAFNAVTTIAGVGGPRRNRTPVDSSGMS